MKQSRVLLCAFIFSSFLSASGWGHAASSIRLNWTVPTTRENGQSLKASELAGYELYYTTDNPAVTGTIKINSGTTSTYTLQNLAAGNYHFAISAVDVKGLKSKLSTVADFRVITSTAAPSIPTGAKVNVVSATTGSRKGINISWMPPKTRTDGASLAVSELSGYKITLRNFFTARVVNASVSGGNITSYAMANVVTGLYIVELAAVDKAGKQSAGTYYYINI